MRSDVIANPATVRSGVVKDNSKIMNVATGIDSSVHQKMALTKLLRRQASAARVSEADHTRSKLKKEKITRRSFLKALL